MERKFAPPRAFDLAPRGQRGFAYVVSLGVVIVLTILGAALLLRGISELSTSERYVSYAEAFYLAEAAADQVIINLRNNNTQNITTTSFGSGSYWAEIVQLGAPTYKLTAHGATSGGQCDIEVVVQRTGLSVYRYPLFGDDYVRLKKGTFTDSYDSRNGDYDPNTAGSNGNVGTNSTDQQSVELKQGTIVNGQVQVGPGMANPSDAVGMDGTSIITANPPVISAQQELILPPIDTAGLDCSSDLSLPKNSTFTFTEANSPYCYDRIDADKGSVIAVTGSVVVYANEVDFDKNLDVNADGTPTQFQLQVYGISDVDIDKGGTFVGAIYAPDAKVKFKKAANVFGSIVAEDVDIYKESQFHFDEALQDLNNAPSGVYDVEVLSWREL